MPRMVRDSALPARPGKPLSYTSTERSMIILGIILLVIGFIAHISILWTIGIILVVIGAILAIAGFAGREIGGRRHWF